MQHDLVILGALIRTSPFLDYATWMLDMQHAIEGWKCFVGHPQGDFNTFEAPHAAVCIFICAQECAGMYLK